MPCFAVSIFIRNEPMVVMPLRLPSVGASRQADRSASGHSRQRRTAGPRSGRDEHLRLLGRDHVHDVVPVVAHPGKPLHGLPCLSGGSSASNCRATTCCIVTASLGLNVSPSAVMSAPLSSASSDFGCRAWLVADVARSPSAVR